MSMILANDRRRFHHRAAYLAGPTIFGAVEPFENALELRGDVFELKVLFVELRVAVFAKPKEPVEFALTAFALDDEADGVCTADRIVRNARRQKEHLALADRHFDRLAVLLNLHLYIAFKLVEKLFALVPMIVLARVRAADDHDDKIIVIVNTLIADGRFQQVPVLVYPLLEIERSADPHIFRSTKSFSALL